MAKTKIHENCIEVIEAKSNKCLRRISIEAIRTLPRIGERILMPFGGPKTWKRYNVKMVEYALSHEDDIGDPEISSIGARNVTIFVNEIK